MLVALEAQAVPGQPDLALVVPWAATLDSALSISSVVVQVVEVQTLSLVPLHRVILRDSHSPFRHLWVLVPPGRRVRAATGRSVGVEVPVAVAVLGERPLTGLVVLVQVSQLIPARCSAVHETGIRALVAAVLPELREVGLAVMVPPTRVVVGADRILVQLAVLVALVVLVAAVVEEAERTVTGMVELAALVVAHRSRFGCSDEMV